VQKAETLNGYAVFVGKVRQFKAELALDRKPGSLSEEERAAIEKAAMEKAVKWCITHDIIKGFLEEHGTGTLAEAKG
jgi:hypothetical protein